MARQALTVLQRCLLAGTLLGGLAACTSGDTDPPDSEAPVVALEVEIVSGADGLDETAKTEVETGIGDILSSYVVRGFLGDYPRDDFVRAFDSFTSGAAREAAQDIDLLTASRFSDATGVAATNLQAKISCLVEGKDVVGATANVSFVFEAKETGGGSQPFSLAGRLMLAREAGQWVVFGYDVQPHDGSPL